MTTLWIDFPKDLRPKSLPLATSLQFPLSTGNTDTPRIPSRLNCDSGGILVEEEHTVLVWKDDEGGFTEVLKFRSTVEW